MASLYVFILCVSNFLDKVCLSDEVMFGQTPDRNERNRGGCEGRWPGAGRGQSRQRTQQTLRPYIKWQV